MESKHFIELFCGKVSLSKNWITYTCTCIIIHDVTVDVDVERKKERHLRQWKNEK